MVARSRGKRAGIPAPVGVKDPAVERILWAIREHVDGMAPAGRAAGGGGSGGSGTGGGQTGETDEVARPLRPENLTANGMFGGVFLEIDRIPANAAYVEWLAHDEDNLANAIVVGTSVVPVWMHYVADRIGRYYWCRGVSYGAAALRGAVNATAGTYAISARDPEYVKDQIENAITESELYEDLLSRIDLIDGPPSLSGSVDDRLGNLGSQFDQIVADLNTDLTADIQAEAQARIDALQAESQSRGTAISDAVTALEKYADDESSAALKLSQMISVFGGNVSQALNFVTTEVDSDLAITTTFNSISGQFQSQQDDIDSRATQTSVNQVAADAQQARADYADQVALEFQSKQQDIDSRATQTALNQGLSDAEQARITLAQSIDTQFQDLQDDVNTRATQSALNQVESDADGARSTLYQQLTAQINAVEGANGVAYRLVAENNQQAYAASFGIYDADANNIVFPARGWTVAKFAPGGSYVTRTFDLYASAGQADSLANFIGAGTYTAIAVLTYGNLKVSNINTAMRDALLSIGATGRVVDIIGNLNAYILIGAQDVGEGEGFERISGNFVVQPLTLVDGYPAQLSGNSASITTLADALASHENTSAQQFQQFSATVDGHTSTLQTYAGVLDDLEAQWSIKAETPNPNNPSFVKVSGIGYSSAPAGAAGVLSELYFTADRIAFIDPADDVGDTATFPFVYENGIAAFDTTLIKDATITSAQIQDLAANKVVADRLSAIVANLGEVNAGTFRTSAGSAVRAEMSSIGAYPLWIGQGSKSASNAWLYVDSSGLHAEGDITARRIEADAVNVIDTLMLRDNAVTIPLFSSTASPFEPQNGAWEEVETLFVPAGEINESVLYKLTTGFVYWMFGRRISGTSGDSVSLQMTAEIRVEVDGNEVLEEKINEAKYSDSASNIQDYATARGPMGGTATVSRELMLSSSSHMIRVLGRLYANGDYSERTIRARYIDLLGTQR